ncbi:hypothetical protein BJY04DRAFT_199848 [Aspergillus karnatakaensis]|uniref:Zn(II)2Cys6 transcription factor domain-containing protein n=1 Tax=Aspergillus karnatakaensis TaxID=1810916 RepID=UPI003CCE06F4
MNAGVTPIKRRACVACTVAKAKCTPQAANVCQRCARLGKSCTYLDLPQTKRKHRPAAPNRVETLEKRVDQLMSQLATLTGQTQQPSPDTSIPFTNDTGSSRDLEPDLESESTDIAALLDAANQPSHGPDPPTGSALQGQPSIVERGLMSEAEAERLVAAFQLDFIPKFPFVVLPRGTTAASLRARGPFLFLCIIAATVGSAHPLRKFVDEEIMDHVMSRIVARSERTLELLRGLLVHSVWYAYPAERHHPRLLLLVQFCVSILYDLGLHKRADLCGDERRALLGTYFMSTGFLGPFGRPGLRNSDIQLNECLSGLQVAKEHISDAWIAPFVNIQSFLATVDEVYTSLQGSGGIIRIQVITSSLERQLDTVRASIEKDLSICPSSTANALRTELKYAEVRLKDLALREDLWTASPDSPVRTAMLLSLTTKCKELIHTVKTLPVSEIPHITIPTSARVCTAVAYIPAAVLALLNLLSGQSNADSVVLSDEVQMQAQAIGDEADFPNVVSQLVNVLETRLAGLSMKERETDLIGSLCIKMRLLARSFPYQVRAIVGTMPMPAHDGSSAQDMSRISPDANGAPLELQEWQDVYGNLSDVVLADDVQWDSILSDFMSFS